MQMKRRSTQDKITANQQQQQQQQAPVSQGQLGSKVANALAKAEARRQKRLARQAEVLRTICCPFVKLQREPVVGPKLRIAGFVPCSLRKRKQKMHLLDHYVAKSSTKAGCKILWFY